MTQSSLDTIEIASLLAKAEIITYLPNRLNEFIELHTYSTEEDVKKNTSNPNFIHDYFSTERMKFHLIRTGLTPSFEVHMEFKVLYMDSYIEENENTYIELLFYVDAMNFKGVWSISEISLTP